MFKTIFFFVLGILVAFPVFSQNFIRNGNFEEGYAHFASDLRYMTFSDRTAGVYTVGSNPNDFQVEFLNCSQHTPNGINMLIVNGSTAPNSIVWRQTTNVRANRTYNLSFWYSNIVPWADDLKLEFWANNTKVTTDTIGNLTGCGWHQVKGTWTSTTDTVITFKIVDGYNLFNGNDFAVDDIEVREVRTDVKDIAKSLNISMYPNPVEDNLILEVPTSYLTEAQCIIVNMLGQPIYNTTLTPGKWNISTESWSKGVYQAYFKQEGQLIPLQKIIKL